MDDETKDIFNQLQKLERHYREKPDQKRFLIDRTPFYEDDSRRTAVETNAEGKYVFVIGRILPTSKIYGQSAFELELKLPTDFPFKAPRVRLLTKIYHPNIGPEGLLCSPTLRSNDAWEQTYTLLDVINAAVNLIDNPNPAEAFNQEIREEYIHQRAEFERKALAMIQANPVSREPLQN